MDHRHTYRSSLDSRQAKVLTQNFWETQLVEGTFQIELSNAKRSISRIELRECRTTRQIRMRRVREPTVSVSGIDNKPLSTALLGDSKGTDLAKRVKTVVNDVSRKKTFNKIVVLTFATTEARIKEWFRDASLGHPAGRAITLQNTTMEKMLEKSRSRGPHQNGKVRRCLSRRPERKQLIIERDETSGRAHVINAASKIDEAFTVAPHLTTSRQFRTHPFRLQRERVEHSSLYRRHDAISATAYRTSIQLIDCKRRVIDEHGRQRFSIAVKGGRQRTPTRQWQAR